MWVSALVMENIVEMSRSAQNMLDNADRYKITTDIDSRELWQQIVEWAKEFEADIHLVDWDDPRKYLWGYYGAIDDFLQQKMIQHYPRQLREVIL